MSTVIPGTVLNDRYRVERIVAVSPMGAVYEATHLELNRRVAIKQLHALFARHPEAVQAFHSEAQNTARIEDAHVCQVYDVGHTEVGAPFAVMSWLPGSSLDRLIQQTGRLPIGRMGNILNQTLIALGRAHGENIVHRDLKPEKIFLVNRAEKQNDFVKFLDLGIFGGVYNYYLRKQLWVGPGPTIPYYISPEQAAGSQSIDNRSNIYSIGVILYEGLTGMRPYDGKNYNEILFKILTQPFVRPSKLVPQLPSSIEEVVLKAMDREPAYRYGSAKEMHRELQMAMEDARIDGDTDEAIEFSEQQKNERKRAFVVREEIFDEPPQAIQDSQVERCIDINDTSVPKAPLSSPPKRTSTTPPPLPRRVPRTEIRTEAPRIPPSQIGYRIVVGVGAGLLFSIGIVGGYLYASQAQPYQLVVRPTSTASQNPTVARDRTEKSQTTNPTETTVRDNAVESKDEKPPDRRIIEPIPGKAPNNAIAQHQKIRISQSASLKPDKSAWVKTAAGDAPNKSTRIKPPVSKKHARVGAPTKRNKSAATISDGQSIRRPLPITSGDRLPLPGNPFQVKNNANQASRDPEETTTARATGNDFRYGHFGSKISATFR